MKRIGLCYTKIMTLQIQLNTELAHRLDVLAISRGTTPEQIVLELL
jgi:predicted DNA-binding protein